ncbi:hypothetical protein ACFYMI_20510 [Streptomyces collinus]|uniref:hypothetical protein n=1 Tax=Streptomyces collinus TaxID=42684 RepID=UPI0036BE5EB8
MSGERGNGGEDLQVVGLDAIAQGITLTLSELKELGMDSMAGSGRGFEKLALSGLELGHDGLTSAFKSFCERWEWGVRDLVIEGDLFARNVGLSAGTLHETDQYVEGALKIGVNSLMGNPYKEGQEGVGRRGRLVQQARRRLQRQAEDERGPGPASKALSDFELIIQHLLQVHISED